MGLFSRKKSEKTTSSAARTSTSSEAQAAELRGRARRRLIGALVLVLTAIIVVPMMFDDTTSHEADTPVVLPAIVPPIPEPEFALVSPPDVLVDEPLVLDDPNMDSGTDSLSEQSDQEPAAEPVAAQAASQVPATPEEPASSQSAPAVAEPKPVSPPKTESKPATPPQSPSKPANDRTDDGSLALAMLEGRVPPSSAGGGSPAASQQGTFVLQVAAYSNEADAQSRRSSLAEAGVTNAYVERAVSNNRTTYRLRVGSFPSRDAAQAAQTRLRALGYDNSMLLTQ